MTNRIKMLAIAGLISMGTALYAFTPKNEICPLKGTAECPLKDVPDCCKK